MQDGSWRLETPEEDPGQLDADALGHHDDSCVKWGLARPAKDSESAAGPRVRQRRRDDRMGVSFGKAPPSGNRWRGMLVINPGQAGTRKPVYLPCKKRSP